MLSKAIQKARGDEEKKVGVSLKMPESFRNKLQIISDKNNVSLNALIIGMLEIVYEAKEEKINYLDRYNELVEIIQECDSLINAGADESDVGFNPEQKRLVASNEIKKITELIQYEEENL